MPDKVRCAWVSDDPHYIAYHDKEWGRPEHDEHRLFEMLTLEGAQAGLSWLTILRKRENYRTAFAGFDPKVVARFDDIERARLLDDAGIVRNRAKIDATIGNAKAWLKLHEEEPGGPAAYLWSFVGGAPKVNNWKAISDVPAETAESKAMSKALKAKSFRFVGPTICYAFMQATGMVDDHTADCYLRRAD